MLNASHVLLGGLLLPSIPLTSSPYTSLSFLCDKFLSSCSKGSDRKGKQAPLDLPTGEGLGDHIQLLQIYEMWDETNNDPEWCKAHGLQVLSPSSRIGR